MTRKQTNRQVSRVLVNVEYPESGDATVSSARNLDVAPVFDPEDSAASDREVPVSEIA